MKKENNNLLKGLLFVAFIIAPQVINVAFCQPPPPPPPPELVPLTGFSLAVIILTAVGYGAYTINQKTKKKVKQT